MVPEVYRCGYGRPRNRQGRLLLRLDRGDDLRRAVKAVRSSFRTNHHGFRIVDITGIGEVSWYPSEIVVPERQDEDLSQIRRRLSEIESSTDELSIDPSARNRMRLVALGRKVSRSSTYVPTDYVEKLKAFARQPPWMLKHRAMVGAVCGPYLDRWRELAKKTCVPRWPRVDEYGGADPRYSYGCGLCGRWVSKWRADLFRSRDHIDACGCISRLPRGFIDPLTLAVYRATKRIATNNFAREHYHPRVFACHAAAEGVVRTTRDLIRMIEELDAEVAQADDAKTLRKAAMRVRLVSARVSTMRSELLYAKERGTLAGMDALEPIPLADEPVARLRRAR